MKVASSQHPPYDGYYKYGRDVAATYERDRREERHWQLEDDFISAFCRERRIAALLDVPVGTGRFLLHYSRIERVVGIDVSDHMLEQAAARVAALHGGARTTLEKGDAFHLRFADRHFDVTIVWRLLHLIPEALLRPLVTELCRVTSHEVVVQTYPSLSPAAAPETTRDSGAADSPGARSLPLFLLRHYRTVRARLNRRLVRLSQRQTRAREEKPWSHIEAFTHQQSLIDEIFLSHGFQPTLATVLDEYDEHCDVRATVYQRALAPAAADVRARPR